MTHTPEPWLMSDKNDRHDTTIWGTKNDRTELIGRCTTNQWCKEEEAKANADRIVACVNACAGMTDPQAEIERLNEVQYMQAYWRERATKMDSTIIERDNYRRIVEDLAASVTDEARHNLRLQAIDLLREYPNS